MMKLFLQEDNASGLRAKDICSFLLERQIKSIIWPAIQSRSKSNLKEEVHEKVPSTKDQLTAIPESWNHIDKNVALN